MSGLNSPKHQLIFNSKLGILLDMLIYTNDLLFLKSKRGVLFGEGCSVTDIVAPYVTLARTELKPSNPKHALDSFS